MHLSKNLALLSPCSLFGSGIWLNGLNGLLLLEKVLHHKVEACDVACWAIDWISSPMQFFPCSLNDQDLLLSQIQCEDLLHSFVLVHKSLKCFDIVTHK